MEKIYSAKVSLENTAYVSVGGDSWSGEDFFGEFFNGQSVSSLDYYSFYLYSSRSAPFRDFMPGGDSAFVVTERVKETFLSWNIEGCEFLPIEMVDHDGNFFVLNITKILDIVNREESEIVYSPDDRSKILVFRNPVFHSADKNFPIFKVPEDLRRVFVSQKIVDLVCSERLSGLFFENPREEQFGMKQPLFGTPF